MKLYKHGGGHSKTEGKPKKSRTARGKRALIITASIAAALIILCTAGVAAVSRIDTVYPNVKLDGADIGGMTDIELSRLLFEKGYDSLGEQTVSVVLPMDSVLSVRAEEVCTNAEVADIVDTIMDSCGGGTALENAVSYLRCLFGGMELESGEMSVDEAAVRAIVENAAKEVNSRLSASQITIGETSLSIVKGAGAISVDVDELCRLIIEAFQTGNYGTVEYQAEVLEDTELDLDRLYSEVYSEAKNAEYNPETGKIDEETNGISFDMSEARSLWNAAQPGDEVVIPLVIDKPEITAEFLEKTLFRDCFCKKATSLVGSSSNRVNNVTKAAAAINGIVLMPGDEFSYNDALGERTAENGYLPAGAYSGGQTVQEYGGGICQVSSTLYYCALYANLNITSRTCHMFPVAYVPPGLDATVSWGGPEFKFVNSRDYPVKLVSYIEDNNVVVELWGTDVDGSYVEMTYGTSLVYDTEYTDVAIGYKAATYRSIYDRDGNLIEKRLEARSTYSYHDEDIKWPEEEEPASDEQPEAAPEPETTPETAPEPEETQPPVSETMPSETLPPSEEPEYPEPPFWEE